MTSSYTLNAKVFSKTESLGPTGTEFTTRSRGATLPDVLSISHKETKNPVSPAGIDVRSVVRLDRTYITSGGLVKKVSWMLQAVIPDDCPAADSTACRADLTAFAASAITEISANIAAIENHEVA